MRSFTYCDAQSHKFWNIELKGKSFTVTFGRVGSKGRSRTREYADEAKARQEYERLIRGKLGMGYIDTTPASVPGAASPMRQALEKALLDSPDDLAAHAAYADLLSEGGDPRGEFIQVQLALEDPNRSPEERRRLEQQERKLLAEHGREWLGGLAPFLLDGDPAGLPQYQRECQQTDFRFARGRLDELRVKYLTVQFARALARAPEARLLRRLVIEQVASQEPTPLTVEPGEPTGTYDPGIYESGDDVPTGLVRARPGLYPLRESPYLGNLRVFQLGEQLVEANPQYNCHTDGSAAVDLIRKMPRVEELYLLAHDVNTWTLFGLPTLTHLRVLQVYHVRQYPLETLARNPALANLTHLLLHPHAADEREAYIGRKGLQALIRSPHLGKLTHLQLHCSDIGDAGCRDLVRHRFPNLFPDLDEDEGYDILKRLKVLDLRHGCITDEGALTLAECPDLKNLELLDLNRNALTLTGIETLKAVGITVRADDQQAPGEVEDRMYLFEADLE